jgi:hypothetical protein
LVLTAGCAELFAAMQLKSLPFASFCLGRTSKNSKYCFKTITYIFIASRWLMPLHSAPGCFPESRENAVSGLRHMA